jgi:hypothetical protein
MILHQRDSPSQSKLAPGLMLLTCSREVPGRNLGPDIEYHNLEFKWFLLSVQVNSRIESRSRP